MPRESMTTVAEWDLQARLRQQQLDQTLTTLRCGPRILVVVNLVLVGTNLGLIALVLCLLGRVGA